MNEELIEKLMKIGDHRIEEENNLAKRKQVAIDRIKDTMKDFDNISSLYNAYKHAVGEVNSKKTFKVDLDDVAWCRCAKDGEPFSEHYIEGVGIYICGKPKHVLCFADPAPDYLITSDSLYSRYIEEDSRSFFEKVKLIEEKFEYLDYEKAEHIAKVFSNYPILLKKAVEDCINANSELFSKTVCPL